ncbi:CcdB family protein [Thauera linaloolentis]|uniref:Toxin CcdB n=1 Tax=Thauera linaloolentis (strain DSM 12138 / JCM 21573 / CCUG 41526 / CIP 105981 / IAM 15112 / NBRC 102519 / 47Lol) TaxID=1123367 RepID=N6YV40_THAL4|nr:CcdB family protein [Thauera linaloolentis]ENO86013.1 cytotoxic protein ccdB [Thauera linaloolentis 47Lol = DSM 12138]MCM8567399.1 CcdB family protein [Thauera linaloolentis]
MAQFDIHRNPGRNRDGIPYVVVVQSAIFDGFKRRVVVPLVRKSYLPTIDHPRFNPTFVIEGVSVVLHPLEIVSVPQETLGEPVASLVDQGARIIEALDELTTRAWG